MRRTICSTAPRRRTRRPCCCSRIGTTRRRSATAFRRTACPARTAPPTGLASTAGKYAAAFALGAALFRERDSTFARRLEGRARAAYALGAAHPGVCQTAPARAPYFYEEDDWADDMELGAAELYALTRE